MNDGYQRGPDCIDAQICRADFYFKLEEALKQCRGNCSPGAIARLQKMKLYEVVDVLAQNGIRMTYNEDWHIDHQK